MLIRTDYSFLINLLVTIIQHNPDMKIYHIIRLNNTEQPTNRKNFNLHCLMDILPMCTCGHSYIPYYYYDDILSLNTLRLFPYFILTEDEAVILSETLECGFFTKQKDMLDMLRTLFRKYQTRTRILLRRMNSIQEQLCYIKNSFLQHSSSRYFLGMMPHITNLLTKALLEKYIHPNLSHRQEFLNGLSSYVKNLYQHCRENKILTIFSENGIHTFLQTGMFETYPEKLYIPLQPQDRIYLIRHFIQEYKDKPDHIHMLRHDIGAVTNGVNIYVTNQCGYLLFKPVSQHAPV